MSDNNLAWENGGAVRSEGFRFDDMDSDEDKIRQMLSDGFSAERIMTSMGAEVIEKEVSRQIAIIFAMVQKKKRPMLFIDQICWHTGAALANGLSLIKLAEKYGQSKQAFEQASARAVKKLRLRKTRTQRGKNARQNMSAAYEKPSKPKLSIPFLE